MKKLFCLLLVLLLVPCIVLSEEGLPLNDFEKTFVGGWSMYAIHPSGKIYNFSLTFTEDRHVYLRTLTVNDGDPDYNTISSGEWVEFVPDVVLLTLSGDNYLSTIKDDVLKLVEYETMSATGFFSRCPDMSYIFGD